MLPTIIFKIIHELSRNYSKILEKKVPRNSQIFFFSWILQEFFNKSSLKLFPDFLKVFSKNSFGNFIFFWNFPRILPRIFRKFHQFSRTFLRMLQRFFKEFSKNSSWVFLDIFQEFSKEFSNKLLMNSTRCSLILLEKLQRSSQECPNCSLKNSLWIIPRHLQEFIYKFSQIFSINLTTITKNSPKNPP